ncbi:MAG: PAS domain S-box protein, partial [candidate division Zixibacteria bacterium]
MITPDEINAGNSITKATNMTAAAVLAIAAFGLLGYIPGWRLLGSLHTDFIPMAPSTAISFILLAVILLFGEILVRRGYRLSCQCTAVVVSVFGLLKLTEYCLGVDTSFEELLIGSTPKLGQVPIGVMSPSTGAIFVLAGAAILLHLASSTQKPNVRLLRHLSGSLGTATIIGAFTFTLGYLYGNPLLYGAGRIVPMAITTAVAFLLLGISIVCTNGKDNFPLVLFIGPSVSAKMMRAFVPVIALSVIGIDVAGRFWPTGLGNQSDPITDAVVVVGFTITTVLIALRLAKTLGSRIDRAEAERQKAERTLRDSEERFRTAITEAPVPIMIHAEDGQVMHISKVWTDITGYSHTDIPTIDAWTMLAYGQKMDDVRTIIQEVVKRGDVDHDGEFEIKIKSGESRIWDFSSGPIGELPDGRRLVISMATDITERKQLEKELREKNLLFGAILDNTPICVSRLDSEGTHTLSLGSGLKRLGLKDNQLVGVNVFEGYPHTKDNFEKARNSGMVEFEDSGVFEGEPWSFQTWLFCDREAGNDFFSISVDITERQRSEKALRESEQRLAAHLQDTPIVAIQWNLDFEVAEWNAAAERVFGYTKDEALGRHAVGLLVPESAREHVNQVWKGLLANAGGTRSVNENCTKDGRTIVCDWNNTSLVNESGEVYGVASLVQDITDRKQAEDELRESEQYNRAVIENSPLGISIRSRNGKLLSVNQAWRDIWQVPDENIREYMAANPVELGFDEKDSYLGEWQEEVGKVYRVGGQLHIPELCLKKHRSTELRWVSQTYYAIKDRRDQVDRVVIITEDITEHKQAEDALAREKRSLDSIITLNPYAIGTYSSDGG